VKVDVKLGNAKIGRHIDTVLRTDAGKEVFAHLYHECGFAVSSLTKRVDGEIASLSTDCKEAQRLIYIRLRGLMSLDLRAAAEALAETQNQSKVEKT